MANATELNYMAILKSVAKVEDDKYEYMVGADGCVEAMKAAIEAAIPIILNHCAENARCVYTLDDNEVDKKSILNQSEPLKKMLGI